MKWRPITRDVLMTDAPVGTYALPDKKVGQFWDQDYAIALENIHQRLFARVTTPELSNIPEPGTGADVTIRPDGKYIIEFWAREELAEQQQEGDQ